MGWSIFSKPRTKKIDILKDIEAIQEFLDDLHGDVVKNMKLVKTSYLINYPDLGVKLLVLIFLAFLLFFGSLS